MEICVYTDPHRGATYEDQLRFARCVEACGFRGFFRADHYQAMGGSDGLPGPTDAWVTMGALARETSRIRLGVLVSPVTFRLPGPLAIIVAQIDQMSGGRIELGLGAGWFEAEHRSYGIPFPPPRERIDRLAEQLQVVTGLWQTPLGQHFTFRGHYYELVDAPALPKPTQTPGPPIVLGGRGPKRIPALAARYADEYNATFLSVQDAAQQYKRVTEAAERIGRAASGRAPLTFSNAVMVVCGRSDAELRRRTESLQWQGGVPPKDPAIGTVAEVVERIGQYRESGADRLYLRLVDMADLDHVELIAGEVLPQVGDG